MWDAVLSCRDKLRDAIWIKTHLEAEGAIHVRKPGGALIGKVISMPEPMR